jgi:hypothetical protein
MLEVTDTDTISAELEFTLGILPGGFISLSYGTPEVGTLFNGDTPLQIGDTFTQEDINNGRISYLHDGTNTITDTFLFTVSDGAGGSIGETAFDIAIIEVNDPPVLISNTGAQLEEGEGITLTTTMLEVSDNDNTTSELKYIIGSLPISGTLLNGGTTVYTSTAFTQEDINNGRISYIHDGTQTITDSFDFTVIDGDGGSITRTTFLLTILETNDQPVLFDLAVIPTSVAQSEPVTLTGVISDTDRGERVTLRVDWGDGSPPETFEYASGTTAFSMTHQYERSGSYTIQVIATDASGVQTQEALTVLVRNMAPAAVNTIPNQQAPVDELFELVLAADIFADPDGDVFNYTATLANGDPLPDWLTFDAATGTFQGTPGAADVGSLAIRVTATDEGGASASTSFILVVPAPQVAAISAHLYLPILFGLGAEEPAQGTADLVGSISISPDMRSFTAGEPVTIIVTITNQGTAPTEPFWADLYINPASMPTVNHRWDDVCGLLPCHGLAWAVREPLAPGETITLTSAPGAYDPPQTVWPGWFAAGTTDLSLLVDSWNPGVATGAVPEGSGEGNNTAHLGGLTVTGENPPTPQLQHETLPVRAAP